MTGLPVGSVVAGHRIDEVVARGGMGVVYRVTHLALQRERALKVIAPELAADESFRSRFRREWRVAASIDHPHAIPIHDAGEADGLLYIAMRYVHGTDLRRMSRESRLDSDAAATIVSQVAGALDAAHSRGLIHRDIKPANILIETHGGQPHAYLTDFGLTKHVASTVQLTDQGRWVGTVDYVAPEQIEGKTVDARTDIYGLGCVAYEALTGEVPFPRDRDIAKIWAHLNEPPPTLLDGAPDLPAALDGVVRRAMAKDPEERFPSAGDFGRAMQAAARGETYTGPERSVASGEAAPSGAAPPPPGPGRRGRPHPEYRRVASVGVTLALVLSVAVVAVALRDGGVDDTVLARQELLAYQSDVGGICDELNRVNRASVRRATRLRKRLRRANDLQALRDAIVDDTQHSIRVAFNLSSRVAGLDAPDELADTQRETVANWRKNVFRQQDYRDRLKGIRSYRDLYRVATRFDSGERTALERGGARVVEGLHRLGGASECEVETPPPTKSIPLPRDPDPRRGRGGGRAGDGSSGSDGGTLSEPRTPTVPGPDVGLVPDSSAGTPGPPRPDVAPVTPDVSPAPRLPSVTPNVAPLAPYASPDDPAADPGEAGADKDAEGGGDAGGTGNAGGGSDAGGGSPPPGE